MRGDPGNAAGNGKTTMIDGAAYWGGRQNGDRGGHPPAGPPRLTDLELAAYMDGDLADNLTAALWAAYDRRLDAHPDQRAFVERVRLVEDRLRSDLDQLLDQPIPDHLLALLDGPPPPQARTPGAGEAADAKASVEAINPAARKTFL